ncbi:adenosylmethionine--8-amino-7-oxononanoate transaminase [Shewanella sp.]|uniref:adenosylmethionine--8-amino-7-oxononanoate transaminase n=1 Tax=Shewanella sp. TaxID=50422 RepID=UPI003A97D645
MISLDYSFDQQHIWHPYGSMRFPAQTFGVTAANGVRLTLDSGQQLVDGTSSWWACIHGYGHPQIVAAMQQQLQQLSHVMFGGITHAPAIELCKKLLALAPNSLSKVFLADSGSIAVEVAMKMALQYWQGRAANDKRKILTVRRGYHGDTFAAMSVCDPTEGMHSMFGANVAQQLFAPAPKTPFGAELVADDTTELEQLLATQHQQIAALIIEPIMQGAGAMWFYSAAYLKRVRELCDKYQVLLILDEIATGFGRTGKLFACEHAEIQPDIMCVGKALTGGYISLAATLCSDEVACGISDSPAGVFMHGPTFMANPLACAAANASLQLISRGTWQQQVAAIQTQMQRELAPAAEFEHVLAVRVLGAVGVIELDHSVDTGKLQQEFVKRGVWVRPFSRFIYIMPPYVINAADLSQLTGAMVEVAKLTQAPAATQFISHG